MSFNRGMNLCLSCFEYVEDCTCGEHTPESISDGEAQHQLDDLEAEELENAHD